MSVTVERDAALLDVQRTVHEYGAKADGTSPVTVWLRAESQVLRDTYQSIAQFTQGGGVPGVAIYAWPITYDPQQRELDRAGIFERCECLIWTPMKDWADLGLTFERIDAVRSTVSIVSLDDVSMEYRIRQKQRASRFMDTDLYIVFALAKRE